VELRHLQYFLAVAETRHFGQAAERLHMAQSPLSQAIRQLENHVGARLFERTTRRVELTSAGESLLRDARRIVAAVEDARKAAAGHEAVIVSHQLPIWATRLHVEGRRQLHDPRRRQCTLCSLTSLHFVGDRITQVSYSEPAGDLIPVKDKKAPFSAGGAQAEKRP